MHPQWVRLILTYGVQRSALALHLGAGGTRSVASGPASRHDAPAKSELASRRPFPRAPSSPLAPLCPMFVAPRAMVPVHGYRDAASKAAERRALLHKRYVLLQPLQQLFGLQKATEHQVGTPR
jgi:hypothetical protein